MEYAKSNEWMLAFLSLGWVTLFQEFQQKTLKEAEPRILESGQSMMTKRSSARLNETSPIWALRLQEFSSGRSVAYEMKPQTCF